MDGKILARLGAVVFVGVTIVTAVTELTRKAEEPQTYILWPDSSGGMTALRQMLRHCRDIGEAATRDPACLKLWADNRDRFLGQPATQLGPAVESSASVAAPGVNGGR